MKQITEITITTDITLVMAISNDHETGPSN
jgi:hypothetical protein